MGMALLEARLSTLDGQDNVGRWIAVRSCRACRVVADRDAQLCQIVRSGRRLVNNNDDTTAVRTGISNTFQLKPRPVRLVGSPLGHVIPALVCATEPASRCSCSGQAQ